MSVASIRGIAKMLNKIREQDGTDDPFEVEAEDDLPFVMLGHWVALSGVSPGALALYWMLAMHLNKTRGDRYVWPTTSILAHMLGYSRGDKIKKFVDELVAIGAVRVIPVPDGNGPQLRNTYKLRRNPPPDYAGPLSLSVFYSRLNEAYEEETAGQAVYPQTGVDVAPQTGGHVAPQMGVVTRRSLNKKNKKDEAASPRSGGDVRRTSTSGSRGNPAEGGSAASGKDGPVDQLMDGTRRSGGGEKGGSKKAKHTREQLELARSVRALFPKDFLEGWISSKTGLEVKALPDVPPLTDAILEALAGDVPGADRTPAQLGARIEQRWNHHGWAVKYYAGEIERLVGAAVAMVRPLKADDRYGCANPRCDAGVDVDTGEACQTCPARFEERKAERRRVRALEQAESARANGVGAQPRMPAQRFEQAVWWDCVSCDASGKGEPPADRICANCRWRESVAAKQSSSAPF
ncbi:hypothetical protein [Streptomyces sp. Wb2n-11]|uniref:hypothetical protein n=1 Tax=Streptomyces sp. Wb2n-11 TaxID=1030533 RepID=UPI000ADB2ABB|nr:hypothetical protein [Streptomyces sp. Wb2n-11]